MANLTFRNLRVFGAALGCWILIPSFASAVPAFEAPPGSWSQNSLGVSLSGEYFSSKANYDDHRGSYKRLPIDATFSTFQSRIKGRYGFSPRWSFFGGTGVGSSTATNPLTSKTSTQLNEVFFGSDFLINKRFVHLVPEIEGGFPINATDETQTSPLTSDGMGYVRAGVFWHHPWRKFRLGGYAGMHVPIGALAKLFLYEGTIDMRLFSVVTFGVGIDGRETVIGDDGRYTDRVRTSTFANNGSMRFYAYNPALIEGRAWIGFRPDKSLWIRAGYAKTIDGMYTAEGQSFLISIAYNSPRLDAGTDSLVDRAATPAATTTISGARPDQATANKHFEADVENTEQGIFDMEESEQPRGPLDSTEKILEKKNQTK